MLATKLFIIAMAALFAAQPKASQPKASQPKSAQNTKKEMKAEVEQSTSHKHDGFLPDEVDKEEIIRRGEWVEQVGVINSAVDQQHSIEAALATPPDDSNKWYISVISTKGCRYCEKLKYDFEHDSVLKAWVNVEEPAKSWAHYQVYQYEDETQKPRFSKIRVKGFPTLLIQPPRNGEFGSSATVVWQKTGYDGNTEKLSREMSNAIKRYVAAINEDRQKNPQEFYNEAKESDQLLEPDEKRKYSATPETEQVRSAGAVPISDTIGVNPPFFVPNKDEDSQNVNLPPEVTGVLTKSELRELLPDADEEFISTQHRLGVTRDVALAAWEAHRASKIINVKSILHYIVVGVIVIFTMFCFFVFVAVIIFIGRMIYVKTIPDKPVHREVIHEQQVVHDSPSGSVSLSKEEYAKLLAASQNRQNQNKSASSQQSDSLIL